MLQACRLIEKKGLATSLRAFAEFRARYPESTLDDRRRRTAAGELQSLAHELRIDNRVSFAGFVSQAELREQFYASHIFLHPSETGRDGNQEGVPNSMLEAMASGLPVFATNTAEFRKRLKTESAACSWPSGITTRWPRALERHEPTEIARRGSAQKLAAARPAARRYYSKRRRAQAPARWRKFICEAIL